MGEAVLAHQAKQRGLDIEVQSSGTADYHVGEEPDERRVLFSYSNVRSLTYALHRTVAVCKSVNHTPPIGCRQYLTGKRLERRTHKPYSTADQGV